MTALQVRMLQARQANVAAKQRLAAQVIQGDAGGYGSPERTQQPPVAAGDGFAKYRTSV
jgi:hypothetical protein